MKGFFGPSYEYRGSTFVGPKSYLFIYMLYCIAHKLFAWNLSHCNFTN